MRVSISIIIPIYKTPIYYLKKCLDSLHLQTLTSIEFLVILDGIQPNQKSLCLGYQNKDNRFKVIQRPHQGVSATRNYGIKQSKGEYITFVDADDYIDKECCKETLLCAKQNKSDIVLFDYVPVDNQYIPKSIFDNSINSLCHSQIEECQKQSIMLTDVRYVAAVSTWCKLIKREFLLKNNIFFSEKLKRCVDRPFSYAIFSLAPNISFIKEKYYNYNKVDGSITNSYYDNELSFLLYFLLEIKHFSLKHSHLIAKYAIDTFFSSWQTSYFTKKNQFKALQAAKNLSQIAKSNWFNYLIEDIDYKQLQSLIKIEVFLFRHSITFPIWLHMIKWKLFSRK